MLRTIFFCVFALPAYADERAIFYGTWGTVEQCTSVPLKKGGTVPAEPFEIRPGWLRHGQLWCRLTWFPLQTREDGGFASAQALCGEDSVRGYRLDMHLEGAELRLVWNESVVNGPMRKCEEP